MRIALISGLAGPSAAAGGVWQVLTTQADALSDAGHEVRVVAGWLGPLPPHTATKFQMDLLRVYPPVPKAGLRGLWSPSLFRYIRTIARWADVAHVNICRDLFTMPAIQMLSTYKVPVVAQPHGMLAPATKKTLAAYDRATLKRLLQQVALFLYVSEAERRALYSLGIPEHKLRFAPNASPPSKYTWEDPAKPVFSFTSRLHPRKQPSVFLEAAINVLRKGTDASFFLIGPDQGEADHLLRRIAQSGYQKEIQLLGPVSHPALMQRLSQSTAMVLPSRNEPFGLVIVEALSVGVPAIVTTETGLKQALESRNAALLIAPTIEETTQAMLRIAADKALRTRLSIAGSALYEESWHPRNVARSLSEHYIEASGIPS